MKLSKSFDTRCLCPGLDSRGAFRQLLAGCLFLANVWPAGSHAQSLPPSGESDVIQEITVTATRREASADTIPVSITAYSQARMDEQGIKNIEDLSKFTPGLSCAPSKAGYINNIALRGVLSDVGAATTGIYIDDTPLQVRSKGVVTESAFAQIFDLERVEILKGPQGTLFGTGSMGGTVRFITPEPSLDHFSGHARAEGGFTKGGDSSYEIGAAVGGPIIQNSLGFRASAFYQKAGGFIDLAPWNGNGRTDKGINSSDTTVVRAALKWSPSDAVTITPAIYYQEKNRDNDGYFWLDDTNYSSADFSSFFSWWRLWSQRWRLVLSGGDSPARPISNLTY